MLVVFSHRARPSMRILIAEDDAISRKLLTWALTDLGHEVASAPDLTARLALCIGTVGGQVVTVVPGPLVTLPVGESPHLDHVMPGEMFTTVFVAGK